MNLASFLQLVLPSAGVKYVAELYSFQAEGRTISTFRHFPHEGIEEMAATARGLDEEERHTYFAVAGYAPPRQKADRRTGELQLTRNGKPKMEYRTKELVVACRAFWIDVDCSPEKAAKGQGYETKKEALASVMAFCRRLGLNSPILIDSGGGLHCYWPLTSDLNNEQWHRLAPLWRQALLEAGVRADPSRDMDIASVLRPPQTHNRKPGRAARQVRVINPTAPEPMAPKAFARALIDAVGPQVPPTLPRQEDRLSDLDGPREFQPSYAVRIAEHCGQLREFYQVLGDVEEPVWRACLGLMHFTAEGDALAHQWSAGHAQYDHDETQSKLDRWSGGPTTCKHFDRIHPTVCKGCSHKGKVTSPIQLGYDIPEAQQIASTDADIGGVIVSIDGITLPKGYSQHPDGGIVRIVKDKDGVAVPFWFVRSAFYPVIRVRTAEGTYRYRFRVHKLDGRVRQFDLDAGATQAQGLIETLASHEVFMTDTVLGKHLRQYVTDFCAHLATTAEEVSTYEQFGWHADMTEFVIGERVYCEDGSVRPAVLEGNASMCQKAFETVRPEVASWVKAVDWIYNRDSMAQMQYALCSGFGSLVGPFQGDLYAGIPLALTDADSGKGKTTVCKMNLTAFGAWRDMTISTSEGATAMARIATLSAHGNIPLLIDEITDEDPQTLASFLYAVANGRDRIRLQSNGRLRDGAMWNLSAYLTANETLVAKLAAMGRDTEGNQVRVFEISTREHPVPMLNPVDVDKWVLEAQKSAGAPGDRFIRYLAARKDDVRAALQRAKDRIGTSVTLIATPQWRFLRYHAECTMAAAEILHELGLVKFDLDNLYGWLARHLENVTQRLAEHKADRADPVDRLDLMLRELQDGIIVTYGYRKGGGENEDPVRPVRGVVIGRYIMGGDQRTEEAYHDTLYLSKQAIRTWCSVRQIDWDTWKTELEARRVLEPVKTVQDKVLLGRGTTLVTGQCRCVRINMKLVRGETREELKPSKLTELG